MGNWGYRDISEGEDRGRSGEAKGRKNAGYDASAPVYAEQRELKPPVFCRGPFFIICCHEVPDIGYGRMGFVA